MWRQGTRTLPGGSRLKDVFFPKRARSSRLLALLLALVTGGCVWPMDPVPTWDFEFGGQVLHAGTGAPVAGALVEIWMVHPDNPQATAGVPYLAGYTNASGVFALQKRERVRATPPFATLRVTPPAASSLAARTVGGLISEVFPEVERNGHRVTYVADIPLNPASAP